MALILPPPPQNPVSNSFEWREWFFALYTKYQNGGSGVSFNSLDFAGSNIDNIVTRDHNTLTNIQGGDSLNRYHLTQEQQAQVIANDHDSMNGLQGGAAGEYYHLTAADYTALSANTYIEAYDNSSTIALSTTPQILKPTSTLNANNISYDPATGEFTFPYAGTYQLTVAVNALATTANEQLYIWAENNVSGTWVVNTNSGKQYALINNAATQCSVSLPTKRVAGQKVRYWISATSSNVSILTGTIPSTTAVVPTIRIQYAGL